MPIWNSMRTPAKPGRGNEWLGFRVLIFQGVADTMLKMGTEPLSPPYFMRDEDGEESDEA